MSRTTLMVTALLFVLASMVGACGGAPPPTTQLTESKASLRAAEEVGAADAPQAALHLKLARDAIAQAERLMSDDENEEARDVLRRAEADAELAIALAKAQQERVAAEEAMRKVQRLKREGR